MSGDGEGKCYFWDWKVRTSMRRLLLKEDCVGNTLHHVGLEHRRVGSACLVSVVAQSRRQPSRIVICDSCLLCRPRRYSGASRRMRACASGVSGTPWRAARWRHVGGMASSNTGIEAGSVNCRTSRERSRCAPLVGRGSNHAMPGAISMSSCFVTIARRRLMQSMRGSASANTRLLWM
jgi:hypothetical protein